MTFSVTEFSLKSVPKTNNMLCPTLTVHSEGSCYLGDGSKVEQKVSPVLLSTKLREQTADGQGEMGKGRRLKKRIYFISMPFFSPLVVTK